MLFLVSNLISLGFSKIFLFFNFIFLERYCPVFFFKLNVCLFLDLISTVDVIPEKADKKKCEKYKVKDQLLLLQGGQL